MISRTRKRKRNEKHHNVLGFRSSRMMDRQLMAQETSVHANQEPNKTRVLVKGETSNLGFSTYSMMFWQAVGSICDVWAGHR